YSQGKTEFLTFLMPEVFGGSSGETFDADSKIANTLIEKGVPESNAQQLAQSLPKYWGDNYSTAGPVYLGAIICILFVIGMVVVSPQQKWWMFAACLLSVLMASGKYLSGFNEFLFHHLPIYNKFRAPTIALVIPQLLVPLLAVLAVQKLFFDNTKQQVQASFKPILYAVGGVFVFIGLLYFASDFSSANDAQTKSMLNQVTGNNKDFTNIIYNSMIAERKSMFGNDLLRALLFALITVGAVFLYLKNWVKPVVIVIALIVISTIELLKVDTKYLTDTNYVEPDAYEANFNLTLHGTATDATAYQTLQNDKDPHFRTFNLSPDRYNESITAYHYRCIGGYNPAKLSIYQDLIENQLSQKLNLPVLNMLDAKYFLAPEGQQSNTFTVQRNEAALGACWFVKNIQFVNGAAAEMNALNNFNPADTAIVDASFKNIAGTANSSDSSSKIQLVSYDNDDIKYASQSNAPNFAVFSEVYYPQGWKAYIDGKEASYCKVNYVLRGLSVPAGKHEIEFKFHPSSYFTGQTLIYVGNLVLLLCIVVAAYWYWKRSPSPSV
ncbi:MAG: YfhO family protein, partial [Bacteroidota bacterium]|nr:YfhO family protein [Bacteroidota bacterium]